MRYELPVPINKYNECRGVEEGTQSFALFRCVDDSSILFIYAHGSKDGRVSLGGELYTLEEVLQMLLDRKLIHERGIKKVQTISCHGGLQAPATIDGVTISSSHQCTEEIHTHTFMTIDEDECIMELEIA